MLDRNGTEMRTGDIVRIENAFFKNDNGLFFVEHSPGDPSWIGSGHCLRKIGKTGKLSEAKYSTCFWPLVAYVSDRTKAALAREWNMQYATIEVVHDVDRSGVKAHFLEQVSNSEESLSREIWYYGENSEIYKRDLVIRDFYKAVAASIQ